MAGPASSSMVDIRPIMQAELKSRAVQLAGILHIRPEGFEGREAEGYQIMGHVAAMPAIKDHQQRRQYGNEILGNAVKAFSPSSAEGGPFHRDIEGLVIQMQEFPSWFRNLTDANETLVENYVTAKRVADAMKWLGWGGLSTAEAKSEAAHVPVSVRRWKLEAVPGRWQQQHTKVVKAPPRNS